MSDVPAERERREDHDPLRDDDRGARLPAEDDEPDIEPFADGGRPTDDHPQHGYGYE